LLIPLATGGGETVVASRAIQDAVDRKERVLLIAHRHELIGQASRKLFEVNVDRGIIKAGFPPRLHERVQVASVQSLHARAVRSNRIEMPRADLIVVDEAQHVRAKTYRKILDAHPGAVILGLTATPCRADGRDLGNVFKALIECPSVRELIAAGFLVPARVFAPVCPDLTGVRIERGDNVESELAAHMNRQQLVGDILEH
jgi:DNA repair protein RadD